MEAPTKMADCMLEQKPVQQQQQHGLDTAGQQQQQQLTAPQPALVPPPPQHNSLPMEQQLADQCAVAQQQAREQQQQSWNGDMTTASYDQTVPSESSFQNTGTGQEQSGQGQFYSSAEQTAGKDSTTASLGVYTPDSS